MKTGVKVLDAMTKQPIVVEPNDKIVDCAQKMLKYKVGSLLVKDKHKLLGIVTEKDMVDKIIAKRKSFLGKKIKEIMTKKSIITISPMEDLYNAMIMMNDKGKRRLPVLDGREVIGLLTYRDIISLQPDLYDIYIEKLKLRGVF
tara:strand:- start:117 stop:548 length:432 start_codon:yes stop_codon:yes gene_type:complete